jgi:monodechloroaminopyrrolnitrin synthase
MTYQQETTRDATFASRIQRLAETLSRETVTNQAIARADPLQADDAIHALPEMNAHNNTAALREALAEIISRAQGLREVDYVKCSAAIRDISMFGGSLVRFELEPSDCVPGFSQALLDLSARVAAHIPRDSFIDYTSRNPDDSRERTFTPIPEEHIFIDSLRRGMAALDSCLENMLSACTLPFASQQCTAFLQAATQSFGVMIDAIVQVKRGITPQIFTHFIRPFFEPFRVDRRAFSAPSGAEMPILNIDQIIWGAQCTDELYTSYFQANVVRLPPIYQQISQAFAGQPSLITRLSERLACGDPFSQAERLSIQQLHQLLTRMYSFRMPHYKVAEENVILRQRESGAGHEVKGSGGFGLPETRYVLDQTVRCRQITSLALAHSA